MTSVIKRFQNDPSAALPTRNRIPFDAPFLVAYMKHIVTIAHKRGCHALAGASNIVPRLGDKPATIEAQKLIRNEKTFEVEKLDFDGAWVVHPLLIETTRRCF